MDFFDSSMRTGRAGQCSMRCKTVFYNFVNVMEFLKYWCMSVYCGSFPEAVWQCSQKLLLWLLNKLLPKLPLTTCIIAVVERKRAPVRKRICSLLKHHWQTARVEGEGYTHGGTWALLFEMRSIAHEYAKVSKAMANLWWRFLVYHPMQIPKR